MPCLGVVEKLLELHGRHRPLALQYVRGYVVCADSHSGRAWPDAHKTVSAATYGPDMTQKQPDQTARWISHALVGFAASALIGKKAGGAGAILGFVLAIIAHDALDAPVAQAVAGFGL